MKPEPSAGDARLLEITQDRDRTIRKILDISKAALSEIAMHSSVPYIKRLAEDTLKAINLQAARK